MKRQILIIDRSWSKLNAIKGLLVAWGGVHLEDIITTNDAEDGVKKVLSEEPGKYVVIINRGVVGKSGFEILKEIKQEQEETPCILTSSLPIEEEEKKKARDLGAIGYFEFIKIALDPAIRDIFVEVTLDAADGKIETVSV
ncbi:unnamed protein product [marine sediment metagenome]|uniref:Response regulatory domain-containing protein n=1 Tax=marine sediment metagenome TaxID=412755 RepID=X0S6I3_9ZZZZ